MYVLYADETNLDPVSNDFFVYGALAVPSDRAFDLHTAIAKLREKFLVPEDFLLKFNPGPKHLNHQEFIELKQAAIEAAVEHGCVLFTDIILHKIATSPDDARRNAINRVVYHFDCYMNRINQHGFVLIDRFNDKQIDAHLREKFAVGLTGMPHSRILPLKRVVGVHYSAIGQSHFPSLIDIVLGSLRLSVNAHCTQDDKLLRTAEALLTLISPMFCDNDQHACDLSLHFSPQKIKFVGYQARYDKLRDFMAANGVG